VNKLKHQLQSRSWIRDTIEVQKLDTLKLGNVAITMETNHIHTQTQDLVAEADVTYVCFSKTFTRRLRLT